MTERARSGGGPTAVNGDMNGVVHRTTSATATPVPTEGPRHLETSPAGPNGAAPTATGSATTPVPTEGPRHLKMSLASLDLDVSSPQSLALSDIDDSDRFDGGISTDDTDEENVMNYGDDCEDDGDGDGGSIQDELVPGAARASSDGGGPDGGDGPPFDDESLGSLGFPPGHVVHISDVPSLDRRGGGHGPAPGGVNVNPSILPSYLFCPLTRTIMTDPVVTPGGHTYERRAVLRHLVLRPGVDPVEPGRALSHEELVEDRLVARAIDRARREAWVRYAAGPDGAGGGAGGGGGGADVGGGSESGETAGRAEEVMLLRRPSSGDGSISVGEARAASGLLIDDDDDDGTDPMPSSPSEEAGTGTTPRSPPGGEAPAADAPGDLAGHGWSVPLGVHRITAPGGLVVTADLHRRSGAVQRRTTRRSLAGGERDGSGSGEGGRRSRKKMRMRRLRTKKQRRGGGGGGDDGDVRTATSVLSSDLVLPAGSHVEVTETRVHGGRVRGHVVWEEEPSVRVDPELALRLEEEAVRRRAAAPPVPEGGRRGVAAGMGRLKSLRRMNSGGVGVGVGVGVGGGSRRKDGAGSAPAPGDPANPFTQDLFDRPPHHVPGGAGGGAEDGATPPERTVEYRGWISLCWAGGRANHDRDETVRGARRRRRSGGPPAAADAGDEDEGPWTGPIALGVYRVESRGAGGGGTLPLHDSADGGAVVDHLCPGRCLEVVETRVVLARAGRGARSSGTLAGPSGGPSGTVRRVRARCMVPTLQRRVVGGDVRVVEKFQGGWITLHDGIGGGTGGGTADVAAALPVPMGAYVVTGGGDGPLASTDAAGRNVRGVLPAGSVLEVDTTRIEFEDGGAGDGDGGDGDGDDPRRTERRVAVRALIASGGYVTLFTCPVGGGGGASASDDPPASVRAEPVPLGTYRVVSPTGLTQGIGHGTRLLAELRTNAFVRAVETRVENGCVRGRVDAVLFEQGDGSIVRDSISGWVNLFQPPGYRWAELSSCGGEGR